MQLDIESIFSHHEPADQRTIQKHKNVRSIMRHAGHWFNNNLPDCPERTLAIRHLQQAMMFANSAIAIYSDDQ